jgi:hypothetical protein
VETREWQEEGVLRGTLTTTETPYGYEYRYADLSGKTMRIERRTPARELPSGPSTSTYLYDSAGRLEEEAFCDPSKRLVLGPEGYAVTRVRRSTNEQGLKVV